MPDNAGPHDKPELYPQYWETQKALAEAQAAGASMAQLQEIQRAGGLSKVSETVVTKIGGVEYLMGAGAAPIGQVVTGDQGQKYVLLQQAPQAQKSETLTPTVPTPIQQPIQQKQQMTALEAAQAIPGIFSKDYISQVQATPISTIKPEVSIPDIKATYVPLKEGQASGSLLVIAGGSVSGLMDIGFGSIAAAPVAVANVFRDVLGKPELNVQQAYETGIALRRPITYGAAIVVPPFAPLAAATALSDVAQKPSIENIAIGAATVVGLGTIKAAPEIAGFLGAGKGTISALGVAPKIVTGIEKVGFPLLGAAYFGITTPPIVEAVSKGDYLKSESLALVQGAEIGGFVVGGMAAGAVLSQFNIKPVFSEKDVIVRESEIQGRKGYFRLDEDFVGRETFEGAGTIQARFGEIPLVEKPATLTGEKITTGTFETPDFFTQRVLVSSEIKGAGLTIKTAPEVGVGFGTVLARPEFEAVESPALSEMGTQYFKSKPIVEEVRVGKITSLEQERLSEAYSIGELSFPSGKIVYEKFDITPLKSVTPKVSPTGSVVSYEEGILGTQVRTGKSFEDLTEQMGSFRVSRVSAIDTKDYLAKQIGETELPWKTSYPNLGGTSEVLTTKTSSISVELGKIGAVGTTIGAQVISAKPVSIPFVSAKLPSTPTQIMQTQAKTTTIFAPLVKTIETQLPKQTMKTQAMQMQLPKTIVSPISSLKQVATPMAITSAKIITMTIPKVSEATAQFQIETPVVKTITTPAIIELAATKTITQTKTSLMTTTQPSIIPIKMVGAPVFPLPKFPSSELPSIFAKPGKGKKGLKFGKLKEKVIIQSSAFGRLFAGQANVATTKKLLKTYLPYQARAGALSSFPTAQEFKSFKKFKAFTRQFEKSRRRKNL